LKHTFTFYCELMSDIVFIHRSIKTRIETYRCFHRVQSKSEVFIHRSIKTRIETFHYNLLSHNFHYVFIHRSIKTRIETPPIVHSDWPPSQFLYIDPLKQGLKRWFELVPSKDYKQFLYIDPLKQGLKLVQRYINGEFVSSFYT